MGAAVGVALGLRVVTTADVGDAARAVGLASGSASLPPQARERIVMRIATGSRVQTFITVPPFKSANSGRILPYFMGAHPTPVNLYIAAVAQSTTANSSEINMGTYVALVFCGVFFRRLVGCFRGSRVRRRVSPVVHSWVKARDPVRRLR